MKDQLFAMQEALRDLEQFANRPETIASRCLLRKVIAEHPLTGLIDRPMPPIIAYRKKEDTEPKHIKDEI